MTKKLRVGILGATGMVGQRFIQLLENHPQFEITALAASDRSQGKSFQEACIWRLAGEMPNFVRSMVVAAPEPPLDCDLVFSSLPGDIARASEGSFAAAGYPVISNSSAYRMDADVPLLIPEVNHEHLALLDGQRKSGNGQQGFIVTNPNCSTIMLALALAPLHSKFGVKSVIATTMQALSGAGYPGVASLAISDNVLPFIDGEEEKIEQETLKILGRANGERIEDATMNVSAQCNRVNVSDGHLAAVRVQLAQTADLEDVKAALASFTALPQQLRLHS
ncbi:MAG: aspartate-semialdehyde dehydrogenase, partial [Acidobacteriota bacterium]|nr:aspartate-semialdehyde dehydrogenase [Acidobacteriota bacterium]